MGEVRDPKDPQALPGPPSPRTTIVGGRPPEGEPSRFLVPVGIQKLLHLAAASPGFLRLLTERRAGVAEAAGIALTRTEQAVLGAISDNQLATMAGAVPRSSLGPSSRQVAAAAVVLLGGAGTVACDFAADAVERVSHNEMATDGGAAPDEPPPRDTAMPAPTGIQPDIPPEPDATRVPEPEPPADPDAPATIPELDEPEAVPTPDRPQPTRGIRPDVPPDRVEMIKATAGIPPTVSPVPTRIEPEPEPEQETEPEELPEAEVETIPDDAWRMRAGMANDVPPEPDLTQPPAGDEE